MDFYILEPRTHAAIPHRSASQLFTCGNSTLHRNQLHFRFVVVVCRIRCEAGFNSPPRHPGTGRGGGVRVGKGMERGIEIRDGEAGGKDRNVQDGLTHTSMSARRTACACVEVWLSFCVVTLSKLAYFTQCLQRRMLWYI